MASTVTLEIPVTQRHIDTGLRQNPYCCPIALAIQDRTNLRCHVWYRVWLSYGLNDAGVLAALSGAAHRFTVSFDNNEVVQPFTFPLEIPVEAYSL